VSSPPRPVPTIVVVSGPPRTGKTTLAHELARAIGCPAVCRDEIKEGMVHAIGGEFEPAVGDPLTSRTLTTFFAVLRVLLDAGSTVVAEAAFQDRLWRQGLGPLLSLGTLRIVQCHVDAAVGYERRRSAEPTGADKAHARIGVGTIEEWRRSYEAFERLSLEAATIDVDTTDGYAPPLPEIVAFVATGSGAGRPTPD
jgi:predicted kinase